VSHPEGPKLTDSNCSAVILCVSMNSGGKGVSGVLCGSQDSGGRSKGGLRSCGMG
jgi:hypothetical protein